MMEFSIISSYYKCNSCSHIFDESGQKYTNSANSADIRYIYEYVYQDRHQQLYKCSHCKSITSQMQYHQKKKTEHESMSQEDSEQQKPKKSKKQNKSIQQKQNERLFYSILNEGFLKMMKQKTIILKAYKIELFGESMSRIIYLTLAILQNGKLKPRDHLSAIEIYFKSALKQRPNSKDKKLTIPTQKQILVMINMINQFLPKIRHIVIQRNFLQGICQLFWSKSYDLCKKVNVKFQKEYKYAICLIMKHFKSDFVEQVQQLKGLLKILRMKRAENKNKKKTNEEYINMKCKQYQTSRIKRKKKQLLEQRRRDVQQQVLIHKSNRIIQMNQQYMQMQEFQFADIQQSIKLHKQMEEEEMVEEEEEERGDDNQN